MLVNRNGHVREYQCRISRWRSLVGLPGYGTSVSRVEFYLEPTGKGAHRPTSRPESTPALLGQESVACPHQLG